MKESAMKEKSTSSLGNAKTGPVKGKKWKAPVLSKLNISRTYGVVGPYADSDGSPSDKS